jgi:hypothetical protein
MNLAAADASGNSVHRELWLWVRYPLAAVDLAPLLDGSTAG